jgi:hypothetical protein
MSSFHQLNQAIDVCLCRAKQQQWSSRANFRCAVVDETGILVGQFEQRDLFQFTAEKYYNWKIVFDPLQYPVLPGGWAIKHNKEVTKKLQTDVMKAALEEGGCKLVSNGMASKTWNLHCHRFRTLKDHQPSQKPGVLRTYSLSHDRNNQRKNGKSMEKKTYTDYPTLEEATCPVKLVLSIDNSCLFLKGGCGNAAHKGHEPINAEYATTSSRFVPPEVIAFAKQCAEAKMRPGKTGKLIELEHGIKLTRRQVAQHQGLSKHVFVSLKKRQQMEATPFDYSDFDKIMESFKDNNVTYVALFHRQGGSELELGKAAQAANEARMKARKQSLWVEHGSAESTTTDQLEVDDSDDMMKYSAETRVALNASDDQDVLIALIWALPEGKRLFRAFPEVLLVDGTHKTNNERKPLLTMGLKDGMGKFHVCLRVWAPNERAWLSLLEFQPGDASSVQEMGAAWAVI